MPSRVKANSEAQRLARRLCAWYRRSARELPWRQTRDPYAIWISEVMLQQTRVEAVVSYYERFLRRFPDLRSLAESDVGEVLAAWAGLGYYRRARQLHASARRIHFDHKQWPRDAASLRLLPGFGPYTAGAVASIAFGQAVPAIDGNVERVLSRRLGLRQSPKSAEAKQRIRSAASELLAGSDPAELNQALMELGARICTPRAPRCDECPWSGDCVAEEQDPEQFPLRAVRTPSRPVACYAAVARRRDEFLLRRLPENAHNAGLWELPTTAWHDGTPDFDRAQEMLLELAASTGHRWRIGRPLFSIRHSITHHRIRCVAYEVQVESSDARSTAWVESSAWSELGLSAASRKILERLRSPDAREQPDLFSHD